MCVLLTFSELFHASYLILSSSVLLSECVTHIITAIYSEEDEFQKDKAVFNQEKDLRMNKDVQYQRAWCLAVETAWP